MESMILDVMRKIPQWKKCLKNNFKMKKWLKILQIVQQIAIYTLLNHYFKTIETILQKLLFSLTNLQNLTIKGYELNIHKNVIYLQLNNLKYSILTQNQVKIIPQKNINTSGNYQTNYQSNYLYCLYIFITTYDNNIIPSYKMAQEENHFKEIMEDQNIDDQIEDPIYNIIKKTKQLQQKEEILKYTLIQKQDEVLKVYQELHQQKKALLQAVVQQYDQKILYLDIGLQQQFESLRKTIDNQTKTIQRLKMQILKQGLSGVNNDKEVIQLKNKREEMENQMLIGKKFSSTQFVRDYLERPQVYRVSYEDVKYQYEMRLKVKESMEVEKQAYEKKKQELTKAIKRQKAIQSELQQQLDQYIK